jgi:hypothetical protein
VKWSEIKVKKFNLDFYFDGEVSFNEEKIQTDTTYKDMLKTIELLLEHSETLSEIRIKINKPNIK